MISISVKTWSVCGQYFLSFGSVELLDSLQVNFGVVYDKIRITRISRIAGSGPFLTFSMDWGPNIGWNTFLKFENPSTGSKVRQLQIFFTKNLKF